MKKFTFILLMLSVGIYTVRAQQIVHACCDTAICIPGSPVDLTCTVDSGNTGSILDISDDTYSQLVNLGFNFTFFGNTYNQCVLSTNAYISFDISLASAYSPWQILNSAPSPANPLNAIYGPWHDVDPSQPPYGTVAFGTFGTAPNRFFVYNFCGVPMYQCNDTLFTGQIIIYEGTNIIETHMGEKRLCETWNAAAAIHGLQDATGNVAVIVPGRNYPEIWTTSNEGMRFTPNGNTYDITTIPYAPIPFAAGEIVWTDLSGNVVGNGFDVTVNPTTTTQYIATLASCGFSGDTIIVVVGGVPADISSTSLTCPNSNNGTVIIDPIANFGPYTYVWTNANGDTLIINTGSGSDTLDNLAQGNYSVTITDPTGCFATYNATVGIDPFAAAFSVSPSVICPNTPVSFTNTSVGGNVTYSWTFGDGGTSTTDNPVHTYGLDGTYNVQLIMTGPNGCIDTVSQQVQVHPNIIVTFTPSDPPYCVGNEITFTDQSSASPGAWAWSFGDGSTSTAENPTHAYSDSGTYIVELAVADNFCGSGQTSLPITVYFIPNPELRGDTLLCPNEVFTLTSGAEGTSYLWSTGDTSSVVTLLAPQETTWFSVTVDNNGCKGTDSVLITIECVFQLPSAFSPNSDGSNDVLHPLGSHVNQYTMVIYNRWGQEVYNRTSSNLIEGWDGKLKGEPQELGVYVYSVNGTFVSGDSFSQTGNVTLVR